MLLTPKEEDKSLDSALLVMRSSMQKAVIWIRAVVKTFLRWCCCLGQWNSVTPHFQQIIIQFRNIRQVSPLLALNIRDHCFSTSAILKCVSFKTQNSPLMYVCLEIFLNAMHPKTPEMGKYSHRLYNLLSCLQEFKTVLFMWFFLFLRNNLRSLFQPGQRHQVSNSLVMECHKGQHLFIYHLHETAGEDNFTVGYQDIRLYVSASGKQRWQVQDYVLIS